MREEPHYTNLLTKEFFEEYYINQKMSYPKIRKMLLEQGYNIHNGTLHKYAERLGIGRDRSEARRNLFPCSLDYKVNYIQDDMIEFIDGFLLGDGGINFDKRSINNLIARFRCGVEYEEFCSYLMEPFKKLSSSVKKHKAKSMKQGFMFSGSTSNHPDIYKQYLRWYPENKNGQRIKQPPEDVRITKNSVLMWYLGDGSVVVKNNTIATRLSTDGFSKVKVEMLVDKLQQIGIKCYRNNENRIRINSRGIPAFYNLIGEKSPIKCYNYKFDKIPFWRFESKRMKEVAEELDINYQKLAYMVKIGKIPCFRLSEKGRPRFLPNHIVKIKKMVESGKLS